MGKKMFIPLLLVVLGLVVLATIQANAQAPEPPAPLLTCPEGFTWGQDAVHEWCAENTPAPTLEMYPGPEVYPTPNEACFLPYPGPECNNADGEVVQGVAIEQQSDAPEPTPTATKMVIVTIKGRGKK